MSLHTFEAMPEIDASGFSRILLPVILDHVSGYLHANDVACGLRCVNKATAEAFRGRPQYTTVRLSQPVPPYAFARQWAAPGGMQCLTRTQRHKLLSLTAASGSISNLEVVMPKVGFLLTQQDKSAVLLSAAATGQLQMCKYLVEGGYDGRAAATEAAAEAGHQGVCEYLLTSCSVPWELGLVCAAARGGHPGLVDWLLQRRPARTVLPLRSIGAGAHIAVRQSDTLLSRFGKEACARLVHAAALGNCGLATLQSLYHKCGGGGAANAAQPVPVNALQQEGQNEQPPQQHQQQEEVTWLGLGWLAELLRAAARSPSADWRDKLQWVESLAPPDFEKGAAVCAAAAGAAADAVGRLRWLRQRGYPVNRHTLLAAVRGGNTAALEYLLTPDSDTPAAAGGSDAAGGVTLVMEATEALGNEAAKMGRLDTLVVLHAHGCPLDRRSVAEAAAQAGHLPVLAWAVGTLGAAVQGGSALLTHAAAQGSVAMMAWLVERGARLSAAAFGAAVGAGCEEALEWMVARGCPMPADGSPYIAAARAGDLATLRCLARLGCPWGHPGDVFTAAVAAGAPLPVLRCLACTDCPVEWEGALRAAERRGSKSPADVKAWLLAERDWQRTQAQPKPQVSS